MYLLTQSNNLLGLSGESSLSLGFVTLISISLLKMFLNLMFVFLFKASLAISSLLTTSMCSRWYLSIWSSLLGLSPSFLNPTLLFRWWLSCITGRILIISLVCGVKGLSAFSFVLALYDFGSSVLYFGFDSSGVFVSLFEPLFLT